MILKTAVEWACVSGLAMMVCLAQGGPLEDAKQLAASGRHGEVDAALKPLLEKVPVSTEALLVSFDSAVADGKIDASEYADLSVKVGVRIMAEANDGATSDDVGVREVATQLQNAVADYNALLQTVYRKGNSATDEELNALQAALDRVTLCKREALAA